MGPVRRGHLPAHGPVILPSLSFSPSLHLFLTPSLPSTAISPLPLHGWRNGGGGGTVHGAPLAPTPFQPSAPLYNILALCFSSLVILANDYEVRISVGPPGISGNVPEIGTRDSRRKSIRMDTVDSIGRFEWMIGARRGKWTGHSRGDLFRWLFSDTDWIERGIIGMVNSNRSIFKFLHLILCNTWKNTIVRDKNRSFIRRKFA